MIQHSENFFPAECGELLALLVKYYKDNPAVKGDKELKGVTAQNIYTFYKEMTRQNIYHVFNFFW